MLDTEFEADEAVCVALALATEDLAVCFGHAPQQVVAVPTLGIVIHEACDDDSHAILGLSKTEQV